MAAFCEIHYGCTGRLTLNGVSMHNPAFVTPLLGRLWFERAHRGEDSLMPGAPGQRSEPERFEQIDVAIPLYVNGWANNAGTPYADVWDGLQQNLAFIEANITSPELGDTVTASLVAPDETTTWSGDVQVSLDFADEIEDPTMVIGVLTIRIPAGRLVAA